MHKVMVEATNPGTSRTVRKIVELPSLPLPGVPFQLKDRALDGLVIAEEVSEPTDERLSVVVIHVKDACIQRMIRTAGWTEEALAA